MKTYKLQPQLRDNCILQGKKEWFEDFEVGDTIYLLSDLPTKKFSIISRIEGFKYEDEGFIYIDKRILGNLAENDEVFILKYNPAEAKKLYMKISEDHPLIINGDWTEVIKPYLLNQLIDLGKEIMAPIPYGENPPINVYGIINSTSPPPPVMVTDQTRIFIEKLPKEKISMIEDGILSFKEERVNPLVEGIKRNTNELIQRVKEGNYPGKGITYVFKSIDPVVMAKTVLNIFSNLKIIDEPTEERFEGMDQSYLMRAVFLSKSDLNSFEIINVQIIASKNSGSLVLWISGETDEKINSVLMTYDKRISELKQILEQKIEVQSLSCPECGADLPIQQIDVNGKVTCTNCQTILYVPKSKRY